MRNIIIKTASFTTAVVVALIALFIGIFSLAYPQGLAHACESYGWYSLSASYYSFAYKNSDDIEYICSAIDESERAENNGKIIKYSEKLFADGKFDDFYAADPYKAESYFIAYATALYKEGNADKAVDVAADSINRGANVPSALGALTILVSENSDGETAQKLLPLVPEDGLDANSQKYYQTIKNLLTK